MKAPSHHHHHDHHHPYPRGSNEDTYHSARVFSLANLATASVRMDRVAKARLVEAKPKPARQLLPTKRESPPPMRHSKPRAYRSVDPVGAVMKVMGSCHHLYHGAIELIARMKPTSPPRGCNRKSAKPKHRERSDEDDKRFKDSADKLAGMRSEIYFDGSERINRKSPRSKHRKRSRGRDAKDGERRGDVDEPAPCWIEQIKMAKQIHAMRKTVITTPSLRVDYVKRTKSAHEPPPVVQAEIPPSKVVEEVSAPPTVRHNPDNNID